MKKQLLLIGTMAVMLVSCNTQPAVNETCYNPTEVVSKADSLIDDTIWVSGTAKHVCCCSKKKLMLGDETDSTAAPLRVLAGGEIDTFSKSLVGEHVKIQGILRLNKITKESLESQLATLDSIIAATPKVEVKEEKGKNEGEKKGCNGGGTEKKRQGIAEKIQWLTDNNKEFIADYYVEAVKFSDCCKQKTETAETAEKKSCCSEK